MGLNLKSQTISGYLRAAASLIAARPGNINPLGKAHSAATTAVLSSLAAYESVPNRRSAFTDSMLAMFLARSKSGTPDGLEDCFHDWLALGRYTGFRKSEWAQTNKHTYETITSVASRPARAVIASDFVFYDDAGHLVPQSTTSLSTPTRVDIRWRFQKNGDNGQIVTFCQDSVHPAWCPVLAAWRICLRAIRLKTPPYVPVGQ